ncbi:MAG: efflux RND transporter periplasmic adaptor subunit [Planctomycetota bacterium]
MTVPGLSDPSRHSHWLHLAANIIGSVSILGLGVGGLLFFGAAPPVPTIDTSAGRLAAPLVSTATVTRWNGPFQITVNGEASTWRVVSVGSEVAGRILTKAPGCRSGLFVNAGDVLFQLDPADSLVEQQRLSAKVAQSEAELQSIQVEQANTATLLKLAEEDLELQREHLLRVRSLFDRRATSETEMDAATRQELTARSAVQNHQNQLASLRQSQQVKQSALQLAQAELARAQLDLARCTVNAPISGRVVEDIHEQGDYVRPGETLVRLSDSSRMDVRCSLRSEELAWVWRFGQLRDSPPQTSEQPGSADASLPQTMPVVPCDVVFEADGVETVWKARLERLEGTGMDRATRTHPCSVVVDQPLAGTTARRVPGAAVAPPALLSGMFVSVRIPITAPVPLFQIPPEALRPGEQLWLVRDGQLKILPISVVQQQPSSLLVHQLEEPLLDGDAVITSPLAVIQAGMQVTVQQPTPPAPATAPREEDQQ